MRAAIFPVAVAHSDGLHHQSAVSSSPAMTIAARGCFGCHTSSVFNPFEQGPALDAIADKLRPGWIERFLADPQAAQPTSRMPKLPLAAQDRADLQALLFDRTVQREASENTGPTVQTISVAGDPARGAALYDELGCATCHAGTSRDVAVPAHDLSLAADKIERDWLIGFLQDPGPDMPDYGLAVNQAADLAAHLLTGQVELSVMSGSPEHGAELFASRGCAACHALERLRGADMETLLADTPLRRAHSIDIAPLAGVLREWTRPGQPQPAEARRVLPSFARSEPIRLPSDYWTLPVPAQGEAPASWSGIERSLHPAACGVCHAQQFFDWRTTLHAAADSPGLRAELASSFDETNGCRTCHTPLSEQAFDPDFRAAGNTCASCHVRAHTRFGPPPRAGRDALSGRATTAAAHGGAVISEDFRSANFCSRCHQFGEGTAMPGGKFIMDVVREWEASPDAQIGRDCQDCHMPDRRHLWRGIHDPDTVRAALRLDVSLDDGVAVHITNAGAGHMLPTYIVPLVVVSARYLDADGHEISGTLRTWDIGRRISDDLSYELSDTRLAPGEERIYAYSVARPPGAVFVEAAVDVHPDNFYLGLYEARLAWGGFDDQTSALYRQAHDQPLAPSYRALTVRQPLDAEPDGRARVVGGGDP